MLISQTRSQLPCKIHQLHQLVLCEFAKPWDHRMLNMFLEEPEKNQDFDIISHRKIAAHAWPGRKLEIYEKLEREPL